ncbi:MAG: type II secretion system protein GspM [Desulfovibrionaceae bacterium]|jgi:general secretion pathway protein M|nr:type II secretion system protein GspM [Desulfovibrionaceae bacterium]
MKSLGQARRPEQLWLLAGALLLLALLTSAVAKVIAVHRNAASRLEQIEPRHARIAGLLQSSEPLAQAGQAIEANLTEFAYPADGEAGQTGNLTLQRVRDAASARGLRVASSQVAAPREDKGFERIGLSLRVEGDWEQMQALLAELARQRPAIYSQTVQINALGGAMPGRRLEVAGQFELYVLKERRP